MPRWVAGVGVMIALRAIACGQSFEVASIKPAQPSTDGRLHIWRNVNDGRLSYLNVSLRDMMKDAFRAQDEQILGPDWLGINRFDVTAKIPDGARSHIPEMLAALMAERFGLSFHRETKDMARYSLAAAKSGSKLQKAESATLRAGLLAGGLGRNRVRSLERPPHLRPFVVKD